MCLNCTFDSAGITRVHDLITAGIIISKFSEQHKWRNSSVRDKSRGISYSKINALLPIINHLSKILENFSFSHVNLHITLTSMSSLVQICSTDAIFCDEKAVSCFFEPLHMSSFSHDSIEFYN